MTILEQVMNAMGQITPEEIMQSAVQLDAPREDEVILGVIDSVAAKVLWALAHRYDRESQMYAHSAKFDAKDGVEREAFEVLHQKADGLEEIARDLAWAEMRESIGGAAWNCSVGLRANFTLVKTDHHSDRVHEIVAQVFPLGGLPLELLEAMRKRRPPPEPPKGKPQ